MKAFVTGIGRGIGKQIAIDLVAAGYEVHGTVKTVTLSAEKSGITCHALDLDSSVEISSLVSSLESVSFDLLVNNAAEYIGINIKSFSVKDWNRVISVNLTAPMLLSVGLKFNTSASIVNIASTDAYVAGYDSAAYSASKAGLISITKSLAGLMAPNGVRVNAVAPGWVDTDMSVEELNTDAHFKTPLGRNATTSEISNVVLFLASQKASFITGEIINVDGGYSITDTVLKKEHEL